MLYGVTKACNLSIVLTDGPYGGGVCGSHNHSHHHDANDSVFAQTRLQQEFYRTLFRQGKFIRQPDKYFFDGGNHAPLGYSEEQYSLPRWTDLTVSRQGEEIIRSDLKRSGSRKRDSSVAQGMPTQYT
jgi:hypothetical protein